MSVGGIQLLLQRICWWRLFVRSLATGMNLSRTIVSFYLAWCYQPPKKEIPMPTACLASSHESCTGRRER